VAGKGSTGLPVSTRQNDAWAISGHCQAYVRLRARRGRPAKLEAIGLFDSAHRSEFISAIDRNLRLWLNHCGELADYIVRAQWFPTDGDIWEPRSQFL
jgi:hypothetical protein